MLRESEGKSLQSVPALVEACPPWVISIALTVALSIAYFSAARLSLALILQPDGVAVFWPAAGVAAGAIISIGSAARVPVIVGTIAATIAANLLGDRNILSSIVFALCNAGEAVLVAGLIERFFGSSFSLDRLPRVLGLFAAAIIGPAVSGIGGTLGYVLFHSSTAPAPIIWQHWFASDAIGILTVAPLLIGLRSAVREPPQRREVVEGALALAILSGLSGLLVYLPSEPWADDLTVALLLPVFLWIAARCRPSFAAAATSITSFAIVWFATFGLGIVGNLPISDRVLTAQISILMFSLFGLILAALFAERREYEAELKKSEARLQNALKQAEQADRAKSVFLAAASHDLRQPLQTLEFLLGTLERQTQNNGWRAALAGMGRSLKTMVGMLDTMLDIDRLETGVLRASMSDFEVNDLFDSIAADFAGPIKEKGLTWSLVRSAVTVHSDRRLLEEMIRNLLSNAVRYTDKGKILLGCRRARNKARIEVWDSGIGIMGEQIPYIFEEYYQIDKRAKRGGFGLGLAIVQRLGRVLDHRIDVHSAPGKGSGFSIEVPLGRAANVTQRSRWSRDQDLSPFPQTILLIEDESFVRNGLESLLNSEGIGCVSVATGDDALTLVTKKGLRPDLVISDYNLPGMNGVDSIQALRAAIDWKIPAIVLTGDIRSHVIEVIAAHEVGVLVKPADADELLQLIKRLHADSTHPQA